jgi:Leucine-rich repeat (LRR) protein
MLYLQIGSPPFMVISFAYLNNFRSAPIIQISSTYHPRGRRAAYLIQLNTLYLNNNKINNMKPLARLTNLTRLNLNNNQSATKACPVKLKPGSICEL